MLAREFIYGLRDNIEQGTTLTETEEIHCKDHFVSHLSAIKEGWRATASDQPEGLEHIHTLKTSRGGRAPPITGNAGTRQVTMQVGSQRRLFLCSIEQTVKEICTF